MTVPFDFDTTAGTVKITHEGNIYTFESGKPPIWDGKGKLKADKAAKIFADGFEQTAKVGGLANDELKVLFDVGDDLAINHAKIMKPATKIFNEMSDLAEHLVDVDPTTGARTPKAVLDHKAIEKAYIKNPLASNLLPEEANKVLFDPKKVKLTKIRALGDRVVAAQEKLKNLHEAGTYTKDQVRAVFLQHGPEVAEHINPEITTAFDKGIIGTTERAAVGGLNLGDQANKVLGKISDVQTKATNYLTEIETLQQASKGAILGQTKKAAAVDKAVGNLQKLVAENPEYKPYLDRTFKKHPLNVSIDDLPKLKTLADDVAKAAGSFKASSGTGAASTAAEKTRGWWSKLWEFKRTPELIAEQTEAKGLAGKTAAEIEKALGKVESIRWNARVLPAAAVIATVGTLGLNAMSKKEEPKEPWADKVRQSGAQQGAGLTA